MVVKIELGDVLSTYTNLYVKEDENGFSAKSSSV